MGHKQEESNRPLELNRPTLTAEIRRVIPNSSEDFLLLKYKPIYQVQQTNSEFCLKKRFFFKGLAQLEPENRGIYSGAARNGQSVQQVRIPEGTGFNGFIKCLSHNNLMNS